MHVYADMIFYIYCPGSGLDGPVCPQGNPWILVCLLDGEKKASFIVRHKLMSGTFGNHKGTREGKRKAKYVCLRKCIGKRKVKGNGKCNCNRKCKCNWYKNIS